jgi:tRNA (guanine6-N2)-methyltransferase
MLPGADEAAIAFRYDGNRERLLDLRTVVAAYLVKSFPVPRPLALLGDQHFRALLGAIAEAQALHPPGTFTTLHLDAAGRDSPVLLRLRRELAEATGLADDPRAGDLQIRLRRALLPAEGRPPTGWEALVRLSPRPLSVRPWRVHNLPGAANATIAAAIAEIAGPRPTDRYLNLLCGSGTLLVERLARAPAALAVGVDLDLAALAQATDHLRAAGLEGRGHVAEMDATRLDLPEGAFDSLAADLPWGQLTGTHRGNAALYPAVLAEAHRVAARGARLVLLTHEVTLVERILPDFADRWRLRRTVRILQGGLHPRIYLLDSVR